MTESQHLQIILTISFSVIAGYTISAGIEYLQPFYLIGVQMAFFEGKMQNEIPCTT